MHLYKIDRLLVLPHCPSNVHATECDLQNQTLTTCLIYFLKTSYFSRIILPTIIYIVCIFLTRLLSHVLLTRIHSLPFFFDSSLRPCSDIFSVWKFPWTPVISLPYQKLCIIFDFFFFHVHMYLLSESWWFQLRIIGKFLLILSIPFFFTSVQALPIIVGSLVLQGSSWPQDNPKSIETSSCFFSLYSS